MIESVDLYRQAFDDYLGRILHTPQPAGLYAPIDYIMGLGGKRMRPVLVLLSGELFGAPLEKSLPAAAAVEIFHNFSLVHDDIMDAAPLRRGQQTVHRKWDANTAILSGDAMLIKAYQQLDGYEPDLFKPLTRLFSRTALEVCEGQQYDMDFESRDDVTIAEYLRMIEFKTAVLLGCALQMGALIGGAKKAEQEALYAFGIQLGLAFQLQDDYLDVFGDPETFGKQVGGDIIENKKTYLYLRALELAGPGDAQELRDLYSVRPIDPQPKVNRVRKLFEECGADTRTREQIESYTAQAFDHLEVLSGKGKAQEVLRAFGEWLLRRDF
ncbi:polyprenyl synthetase family protein [Robiginitalea sp. SC105]|uniref:polyprenyl synthetase family protein n=1 Tax=Robiginitalea sp. SC105 TaxID=2762332 RepID=UPI00163ADEAD|nr:polyprenyl synthetase family protein [Robiginitalea sp. SC105]MBC2838429.1 polyprenyl synthetase family protein [Robiginitalea sp. SC105]